MCSQPVKYWFINEGGEGREMRLALKDETLPSIP